MRFAVVVVVLGISAVAHAQRWQDATSQCMGTTAEWTSKVEVADLDGDGHIDILLANGGEYSNSGSPQPRLEAPRIWKNLANWATSTPHCQEITSTVVGTFTGFSRMIK